MYTLEEIEIASKTARHNGFVGQNSIIPRIVQSYIQPEDIVLDYGAGFGQHTIFFREQGYKVSAYDFNPKYDILTSQYFIVNPLPDTYSLIYASNVLNVQSSLDMLKRTLEHISSLITDNGIFIANYPKVPRKLDLADSDITSNLLKYFNYITIQKYSSGIVYVCSKEINNI